MPSTPRNFEVFNDGWTYSSLQAAQEGYWFWTPENERALQCGQCHNCEELCPQKIMISEWMPHIHAVMTGQRPFSLK